MTDDQFKQLTDHIDKLDERLLENGRVIRDEMHQGFEQFNALHEELKEEVRTGFDRIAARLDIDDTERAALESQVERHDGWIKQLANNTKIDLAPEA